MLKLKNNHLNDDRASQIVSWGHWFALFNIFVVIILGSRYLLIADWPPTLLGRFYAIISCIGHFSFLTFIVYLVLLFPLSFFIHSSKWQRIIATLVATISLSILLIDIEVFSRFRMHLNFSIWQILTSPDDNILSAEWQKLFIFVPLILLLETIFALWSWRKLRSLTKRRRYCAPVIITFMLCFFSSHLIHIWADANFYRPITMQRSSLPVSYPMTARHFLERHGFLESGNYESRIKLEGNPFAMAVEYPLGRINYEKPKTPYNILMVVVDDWNKQLINDNMPLLTQFAQENLYFDNHYSASEKPCLSEFSIFYGLDANYYSSILASHKSSVLIDTLSRQQYNLGLFSSDQFSHSLYRYALLSNFSLPQPQIMSNKQTTEYWLSWHQEQQKSDNKAPWFSIIQYRMNAEDVNKPLTVNEQINNTRTLDKLIHQIVVALQEQNELQKTVVIITGSTTTNNNDIYYDRNSLNVPLVVSWPNKTSEVITKATSHVDIVPTLMLNVLNVKTSIKLYSQGVDLFENIEHSWLIAGDDREIAALYKDKTIIIDDNGHYQIYDLYGKLLEDEQLSLSTFLQLISENRRFMVTH